MSYTQSQAEIEQPLPVAPSKSLHARAAQYVRMSTDLQEYSTQNQAKAIAAYAEHHGLSVVRTYADSGRSGLNLDGRPGLQQLLKDVQSGEADFKTILVYDVSRWGRFQDADESAYYEYLCRRAGIHVVYCAEQFDNDGSIAATIVKTVKRAMAGEYSRELSVKVFAGQCRLIENGYRQGGRAGYGLRRVLIDRDGVVKTMLAAGEQKSLQTDRVILVAGPEEEVRIVHQIYQWFIDDSLNEIEIANRLNAEGLTTDIGRPWTARVVHTVLSAEKYIGNNIYNRISKKLKLRSVANSPDMWIRKDAAFQAIVPLERFAAARKIIADRAAIYENDELLDHLRTMYQEHGHLSRDLIEQVGQTQGKASPATYGLRFKYMLKAYQAVGFRSYSREKAAATRRQSLALYLEIITLLEQRLADIGATVSYNRQSDLLRVNGEFSIALFIARYETAQRQQPAWSFHVRPQRHGDISIVVRLDHENARPLDYYLIPRCEAPSRMTVAENKHHPLDRFRYPNLEYLVQMARRSTIRRPT